MDCGAVESRHCQGYGRACGSAAWIGARAHACGRAACVCMGAHTSNASWGCEQLLVQTCHRDTEHRNTNMWSEGARRAQTILEAAAGAGSGAPRVRRRPRPEAKETEEARGRGAKADRKKRNNGGALWDTRRVNQLSTVTGVTAVMDVTDVTDCWERRHSEGTMVPGGGIPRCGPRGNLLCTRGSATNARRGARECMDQGGHPRQGFLILRSRIRIPWIP